MKYRELSKKYPKFVYQKCSWNLSNRNLEIFFDFAIEPNIKFRSKIVIEKVNPKLVERIGDMELNNLVFHLGLMEIPSYWKATCSPQIIIKTGLLNKEQLRWWKDLILQGMGQFFYENKIDFRGPKFLKITSEKTILQKPNLCKPYPGPTSANVKGYNIPFKENDVLVPIGGGKDSVVTLELFKKAKKNIQCFSLNPTEAAKKIMKIASCKEPIIIKRKIDKKLLELNQKGFLNGHTPFSAYLAFLSILVAAIFNYKYIAFSNERSSNEGNLKYLGKIINHQWSKSFEFEQKFRKYQKKYLTPEINYFSFLRPLSEIQIAKLFSKYPKYFSAFLSCNEAYKTASGTKKPTGKWCGNCPKCLFVFAILYPFIETKKLIKIFGQNLFIKKELMPLMQELIGEKKFKPFECVGTKKESLVAFYLSWEKYRKEQVSVKPPFFLKYFEKKILPKYSNLEKEAKKILNSWNNQHFLPKKFDKILESYIL